VSRRERHANPDESAPGATTKVVFELSLRAVVNQVDPRNTLCERIFAYVGMLVVRLAADHIIRDARQLALRLTSRGLIRSHEVHAERRRPGQGRSRLNVAEPG